MGKKQEQPKLKKLKFLVDPCQGIASMVCSLQLEGYVFYNLERKNTKATATFIREDLVERKTND